MTVDGTWNLDIVTPLGMQRAVLELSTTKGALRGVARGEKVTGHRLARHQASR